MFRTDLWVRSLDHRRTSDRFDPAAPRTHPAVLMRIVIVGAGAVGSYLAERLVLGGQDIVLVESDEPCRRAHSRNT